MEKPALPFLAKLQDSLHNFQDFLCNALKFCSVFVFFLPKKNVLLEAAFASFIFMFELFGKY